MCGTDIILIINKKYLKGIGLRNRVLETMPYTPVQRDERFYIRCWRLNLSVWIGSFCFLNKIKKLCHRKLMIRKVRGSSWLVRGRMLKSR